MASAPAWKTVLKGVDGVVFVADSTPTGLAANRESLALLQEQLQAYGTQLNHIPCVVQFNKRDDAGALPLDDLRQVCAAGGAPSIPATARKGEGVFDTLSRLVQMVVKGLSESGLELAQAPEHLAMAEPEVGASSQEPAPRSAGEEPGRTCPVTAEVPYESGLTDSTAAGNVVPSIEMGEPVALSDGRLRLPLVVRHDGKEKKVVLSVSLSLEAEETD